MRDRFFKLFRWQRLLIGANLVATMWIGVTAQAVSIWTNPITGSSSDPNPYTIGDVKDNNITVSGLGATGVTANAGTGRYNWSSWATSLSTDFFSWTLTPNANFKIDFTSLTGNWQGSSTGPNNYALRSSLDGFGANIVGGTFTNNGSAQPFNLNLGAATFDNITSAITFRLYAWNPSGQTAGRFSINDFTFDGAVSATVVNNNSVITAPASAALGSKSAAASFYFPSQNC
jgi:hypothetical protein